MFGGHVKGLLDALTNRHRRHDDDELRPSVSLVQLHERFDVDVRLAGTRLHLNVEVRRTDRRLTVLQDL